MILKIFRPTVPQDALYQISDQSGTVFIQARTVPGRVAVTCQFRPSYWTAIVVRVHEIEFRRQVEDQTW
jgi:hypothetical protein